MHDHGLVAVARRADHVPVIRPEEEIVERLAEEDVTQ